MTPRPARLGGPPVRALLLDYGGTLVEVRRPAAELEAAYARIARRLQDWLGGLQVPTAAELIAGVHDRVDEAVAAHAASGRLEEIDLHPVYRGAYAALVRRTPDDRLLGELVRTEQLAWFAGISVADGTVPVLGALRAAGLRLGICSNAPYLAATLREQIAHLGLAARVDAVTLSCEVGWRKPSPRIFETALAGLGTSAEEAVMVGDRLVEDVEGARAAGLRGVWLRPAGTGSQAPPGTADAVIDRLADLLPLLGLAGAA